MPQFLVHMPSPHHFPLYMHTANDQILEVVKARQQGISLYTIYSMYGLILGVASYPGLFISMFVACNTNAGEFLVKLIASSDVPGCWVDVEKWHIPSVQLYMKQQKGLGIRAIHIFRWSISTSFRLYIVDTYQSQGMYQTWQGNTFPSVCISSIYFPLCISLRVVACLQWLLVHLIYSCKGR